MGARRLPLAVLASLVGLLVLDSAVASAAVTHEFLPSLSVKISEAIPPGTEVEQMVGDSGHLLLGEQRRLYPQTTRISEFDALSGELLPVRLLEEGQIGFLGETGVAIGHLTGEEETYVSGGREGEDVVAVFGASGTLRGVWNGASTPNGLFAKGEASYLTGVAVDDSTALGDWATGDVYVSTREVHGAPPTFNVVDVFRPQAGGQEPTTLAGQLTGTCSAPGTCSGSEVIPFRSPIGVAVSGFNGDVLVADEEPSTGRENYFVVDVFEPVAGMPGAYNFLFKIAGTPNGPFKSKSILKASMAVDADTGNFYVVGEEPYVVDEFDAAGQYLLQLTGTPLGSTGETRPFGQLRSVAFDSTHERLFVSERDPASAIYTVDAFGPDLVVPDVVTGPVANVRAVGEGRIEATLTGTVDPDNQGEASCWFVWGTTREFGQRASCEPEKTPDGGSPVAVRATLEASKGAVLAPDTTYYYRLQARNTNGSNLGDPSQDQQFTTPGPGFREESVSDVASGSATLNAMIDPHGVPTSYYFQYGTGTSYEAQAPLAPGAPIGLGQGGLEVSQHVGGLTAGTVYHYRVVAVSELEPGTFETFAGPDRTFTTQVIARGSGLLDGRSWEMVSPPVKHGALLSSISETSTIQAAAGGGAMTYEAFSPTEGDSQGNASKVQVLATRGVEGWSSRDIALPHEVATTAPFGFGPEYRFFSEDMLLAVVQPYGPFIPASSPLALAPTEASEQTAFLHTNYVRGDLSRPCLEGCYRPLVTGMPGYANVPPGTVFAGSEECSKSFSCGPQFVGATPDLSHVMLFSDVPLVAGVSGGGAQLYEWAGGRLSVVGMLPEEGGLAPAPELGFQGRNARHAVSDDGSRIVWSSGEGGATPLYLRDMVKGETVQLDAVQGGSGEGRVSPIFQTASSDGSRVFFSDTQQLTADSRSSNQQRDLYECEMVEVAGKLRCNLTDLTPSTSREQASVQGGVLGASSDGSWVYFVADGVLASGAVRGDCSQANLPGGVCNLYVWHDGTTRLVAVVPDEDAKDWDSLHPGSSTTRVSPNGEWLAFMSQRELTGYVTRDAISGKSDEEVYLYHAAGPGSLTCVSCNPTGARPLGVEYQKLELVAGDRVWESGQWIAANVPGWMPYHNNGALYQSRYLSNSGRLFFNSSDALVPQDVNGNEDVYEYEPAGTGGCTAASPGFSERSGGCVGLVSSGGAVGESAFLDASETGGDVFFLTFGKLAAADFDTTLDVYDAHECRSSSPCFAPSAVMPPPCSTGDGCKAPPSPQPTAFGAPASATFAGQGNVTSQTKPMVRHRSLTRMQRLRHALQACHHEKRRRARKTCERTAHARFARKAGPSRVASANKRGA